MQNSYVVETPLGFTPSVRLLLYYGIFFIFGVLLNRQPNLLENFSKNRQSYFYIAIPSIIFLFMPGTLQGSLLSQVLQKMMLLKNTILIRERLTSFIMECRINSNNYQIQKFWMSEINSRKVSLIFFLLVHCIKGKIFRICSRPLMLLKSQSHRR